jgi:predicted MFS family arabinose efflux permease
VQSRNEYLVVTGSYWAFTITDGALRMLVLLHLHDLGYTPLAISSLFLFYEVAGVLTNLLGGWVGARFGLKSTLTIGLCLQIGALGVLFQQTSHLTLAVLMVTQAASGVAKDLTKMSSKSFIKLLIPEADQGGLMKWVAILTGSKNALKGAGFFVGGMLLQVWGFGGACLAMVALLSVAILIAQCCLSQASGKSIAPVPVKQIWSHDSRINLLSASRFFLFGSRDAWFVLALPIYLSSTLHWSFQQVGGFLAIWVIGYGFVQSMTPWIVGRKSKTVPNAGHLTIWTGLLVVPLALTIATIQSSDYGVAPLVAELIVFGAIFAAASAIHSYLIVSYAKADKASLAIGFYYSANALGRLVGTIVSGAAFQYAGEGAEGLTSCLWISAFLVVAATGLTWALRSAENRHQRVLTGE